MNIKRAFKIITALAFISCAGISVHGQYNVTRNNVTILDSLILTDTTVVPEFPKQDSTEYADTSGYSLKSDSSVYAERSDSLNDNTLYIHHAIFDTLSDGNGLQDLTSNVLKPPYTYGYFADSSVTISITEDVYSQVTNTTDSLFRIIDYYNVTRSGDSLINSLSTEAYYTLNGSIGFEGTVNNTYFVQVNTDDGVIYKMGVTGTGAGNIMSIPINTYWVASADERLWIEITNEDASNDADISEGAITLIYIHN